MARTDWKTIFLPAKVCRDCGNRWVPGGGRGSADACPKCSSRKVRPDWIKPAIGVVVLALLIVGGYALVNATGLGGPGGGDTCTVEESSAANLRREPAADSKVLRVVDGGTHVRVLSARGNWIHVHTPSGDEGWVHRSTVTCRGASTESAAASKASGPRRASVGGGSGGGGGGGSRRGSGSGGSGGGSRAAKSGGGGGGGGGSGVPPAFSP